MDANTEWKSEKKHGIYRLKVILHRFPISYEGRRKFTTKNLTNKT